MALCQPESALEIDAPSENCKVYPVLELAVTLQLQSAPDENRSWTFVHVKTIGK